MKTAATKIAALDADKTITVGVCLRCSGLGRFEAFGHVSGGTCFDCGGDRFRLYTPSAFRGIADADLPRAVRLDVIRQALAAFAWIPEDAFLSRAPKACRAWLSLLIQRFAATLDVVVYDRAGLALHAHSPRNWAKFEAKRAALFPSAGPMIRPAAPVATAA